MDMAPEVLRVADVDHTAAFYTERLGFRLDVTSVTTATPGSGRGLRLITTDIDQTDAKLTGRGIAVDGPFRDPGGNEWFPQEVTQRAPGR